MSEEHVMFCFVNHDLSMSKGKIAGQVGHAVQYMMERVFGNHDRDYMERYTAWRENQSPKIILKARESDLLELMKRPDCVYVHDAGRTQIPSGSLTVVAFVPEKRCNMAFAESYNLL
jgi:PTH2 family peptidyl-tRNA hydrolase